MKIQSQSDIITNSSSEVFIQYDRPNIELFKSIIENIINTFNEGKKLNLNDIIEIIPVFDQCDYIVDDWKNYKKTDAEPTEEDLIQYAFDMTTMAFESGEKNYPMIINLEIKAKDPKYEDLAKTISGLINIFPSQELYC